MIKEKEITKLIINEYFNSLLSDIEIDVAIVGAGPSGLTAARILAKRGKKVAIFESRVAPGGGMWGGGMLYPVIVVKQGKELLEEVGVKCKRVNDYWTASAIETTSKLISAAIDAGARLYNGTTVEDIIVREGKVSGVVINWTPALQLGLLVDPLSIEAKFVIDATGHDCYVAKKIEKLGEKKIEGEKAMWAEMGEKASVEHSKEIYPGLYVAGMAAIAYAGSPRMGPIFGGMLLSGKKVAEEILKKL